MSTVVPPRSAREHRARRRTDGCRVRSAAHACTAPDRRAVYEQVPVLDLLREHPGRPSREWLHEVGKTLVGVAALVALVVMTVVAIAQWLLL